MVSPTNPQTVRASKEGKNKTTLTECPEVLEPLREALRQTLMWTCRAFLASYGHSPKGTRDAPEPVAPTFQADQQVQSQPQTGKSDCSPRRCVQNTGGHGVQRCCREICLCQQTHRRKAAKKPATCRFSLPTSVRERRLVLCRPLLQLLDRPSLPVCTGSGVCWAHQAGLGAEYAGASSLGGSLALSPKIKHALPHHPRHSFAPSSPRGIKAYVRVGIYVQMSRVTLFTVANS